MLYLVDANVFIQAQQQHYSMDFCPAFWDFLKSEATKTTLASIDMVYEELESYGDIVAQWVKENKSLIFTVSSQDTEIQKKFIEIADYVNRHPIYKQSEKDRFLDGADPWLIATASVLECKIVTHEVLVPSNSTKVKIPNVAQDFGVDWINPYDMIRRLNGSFILS